MPSSAATARAALLTIADAVIAPLPAREGPPRAPRLRRPDRQDAARCSATVDAAWVHYKLDLGIDHVLIDEAQDTSPKQWEIVRRLAAEFFAGAGARAHQAHDLRGRRREAVDLLVPGRGAARVRRDAASTSTALAPRPSSDFATCRSSSTRSARRRTCSAPSTRCSTAAEAYRGRHRRHDGMPPHESRCRTPRRAWSRSGPLIKPDERARDRSLGRAVRRRCRRRARRCGWRSASPARCARHRRAYAGRQRRRSRAPGDVLILVRQRGAIVRGDHPRAEGRRCAGRRRRPAGA